MILAVVLHQQYTPAGEQLHILGLVKAIGSTHVDQALPMAVAPGKQLEEVELLKDAPLHLCSEKSRELLLASLPSLAGHCAR